MDNNPTPQYFARLFIDTCSGVHEKRLILQELSETRGRLDFDLREYDAIKNLRFDPLNTMVVLRLEPIKVTTTGNTLYDDVPYTTNALCQQDNILIFETNEPMIWIDLTNVYHFKTLVIHLEYIAWGDEVYRYIGKETLSLIKCKDEKISQQQQTLQEQEQILQQQARKIYRQARIIRQQEQRIRAIENTLSWKITEPLRRVDRFLSPQTLPLSKVLLRIVKRLFKNTGSLSLFPDMESKEIKVPEITLLDISEPENISVENTTISVIIPVLNGANHLRLLLPMLKKQKGIKNIEIIIVDSGSTDSSIEICRNFETKIVIITPDEFSHSYARNIGAEHAHGQYLLFLTQDALPPNDTWLYEMLSVVRKNDVVAVSCKEYPRSDADLFGRVQMWTHYTWLEMVDQDKFLSKPTRNDYHSLRKNCQLSNVACLVKKEVFLKYKFRGEFAEDIDFGLRLIHDGYNIAFVNSVGILHSHTRPGYYHLKRGYIDSYSMAQLFNKSPQSETTFNDLCDEIILTYFNVNNAVKLLKHSHKADIDRFFEKFFREYNNLNYHVRIKQRVNFSKNEYLDEGFKSVLLFIKQHAYLYNPPETRIIHLCLKGYINSTRQYLENIYESFDDNLLKDFSTSLYKALAFYIGEHLANCYISNPHNPELIKLHNELSDKKVQQFRV